MPYTRLFYHLVWATKNRLPLITPELEPRLWSYLHRKAAELECRILAINGWQDHVHVVLEIPPKHAVATVVKRLKGASSHEFPDLFWQRGYGALSVSERNLHLAIAYVNRQKEHHARQTAHPRLELCEDDAEEGATTLREETIAYNTHADFLF